MAMMTLQKVAPGRGFTIKRKSVKTDTGRVYNFEAAPATSARRRKVIDGATMNVQEFGVDVAETTLRDLQSATLSTASFYTGQQADLGNPPIRVLVDNSPVKSPMKVRKTIDVYFGTDARPSMEKVAAIVSGTTRRYVSGVAWTWKIANKGEGYRLVEAGPVPMNSGDRLILVPTGAAKDLLSLYNIAHKLNINPKTYKKLGQARKNGFLQTASRSSKNAVSPLFYVRMRFSDKVKAGAGTPSKGLWNPIRTAKGLKPVYPRIQGDPVFIMTLGLGGRLGNIGRRT